ncbi:molybdopterin molybdotransferase MoeA [soil metagenome]
MNVSFRSAPGIAWREGCPRCVRRLTRLHYAKSTHVISGYHIRYNPNRPKGIANQVTDIDRMLHPDEARQIVITNAKSIGTERIPIEQAGGRVLSEPLVASQSLPPFRASTMDGFAVVHDDAAAELTILAGGLAGSVRDEPVEAGFAARIMTGAPVPEGADAVVPVENTVESDGRVRITQETVREGDNIRPIGSDMMEGDRVLEAGIRLTPPDLGLLASLGHARVIVGIQPRVAVMSTGDEIVAPDVEPGPGQIRDSNRFSLAYAAEQAGGRIVMNRHVADDIDELRSAFADALASADVIITSGGVSMGDRDLVKALLGELSEVHFRRVFMKPGKPLNFATAGEKLIFGLPGNPVSCLVSFHMFAAPALGILQGAPADAYPRVPVRVVESIRPSDRIEYQRAKIVVQEDGTLTAVTTGSQQSARLQSFVGANGFLVVPASGDEIPSGSTLEAIPFAPLVPASIDR